MENKKELIIKVATELFSERGFENTSMSAVCEKASVSKGLIFHHFKSKDDLLREIFKKTTQIIIEVNEVKVNNQSPKQRLLALLESFFVQLKEDKLFFQLNLSMIVQPKTRELLNDLIHERSSFILQSVIHLFEDIDHKNSIPMSHMFIAELDGIALNYLGIFDNYPLEQIKNHLINKYKNDEIYKNR